MSLFAAALRYCMDTSIFTTELTCPRGNTRVSSPLTSISRRSEQALYAAVGRGPGGRNVGEFGRCPARSSIVLDELPLPQGASGVYECPAGLVRVHIVLFADLLHLGPVDASLALPPEPRQLMHQSFGKLVVPFHTLGHA